jgi:hypothetical protein
MIALFYLYLFVVVFHYGLSCYISWLVEEEDPNRIYDIGMALVWPITLAAMLLFFIPVLVTVLVRKRGER